MTVEIPDTRRVEDVEFSASADVVVIGAGIAGLSAAVSAAEHGGSVILLERAGTVGGTTVLSGGQFYLGGGTAVQKATGFDDSPEEMAKYLTEMSVDPDPETIEAYAYGSVEHFEWLEALGFEFERSYYDGKAVIQPGTEGLLYTGNEKVWPVLERAKPAPRGHKVPVPGDTGGAQLVIDKLLARAESLGVDVRVEVGARQLVVGGAGTDGSGASGSGSDDVGADGARVVGVACKTVSGEEYALGAKGVVIAAGGFVMNHEMLEEYAPHFSSLKAMELGSPFDDGLGIRLGVSAGGATRFMDHVFCTAPFYPPSQLVKGLIVNAEGRRFVAEDSYHARTTAAVFEQPDRRAYLIVDSEHIGEKASTYYGLTPFIDGWETVEEMADGLGVPRDALAETLEAYNANARAGEDPQFHKQQDWLAPQDRAPWAAYDLSAGAAMYTGFTFGGLSVDAYGRVRRDDGGLIPGLYAVGASAPTIAQDSHGYSTGSQLGGGSFFGRRAGRHAAGL